MSDPASLIAFGAAIGGAAGKLVECTWESGERWLRERFGSHDKRVQERARTNAAHFINRLAERVEALERQREIGEKQVNTQSHPEFSALLQRSLLNAAQTEDNVKQDLLANLVASRLASEAETTFALASQLASDAISRSTRNQLTLMALCCFLDEVRPESPLSCDQYRLWLQIHLRHFENFEFRRGDAYHLVAIACATYDPSSERSLDFVLRLKGGGECVERSVADLTEVEMFEFDWAEGLAGVSLTSVGSVVGGLALEQIYGRKMGPPTWF